MNPSLPSCPFPQEWDRLNDNPAVPFWEDKPCGLKSESKYGKYYTPMLPICKSWALRDSPPLSPSLDQYFGTDQYKAFRVMDYEPPLWESTLEELPSTNTSRWKSLQSGAVNPMSHIRLSESSRWAGGGAGPEYVFLFFSIICLTAVPVVSPA